MSLTQIQKDLEQNSQNSQTQIEQLMQKEKQSQIEELKSIMSEQSNQIEDYKILLAKKEEELKQEKIENIQLQGTMKDTQDKFSKCYSAYKDLQKHPKIEKEIVYKNIPTIDNRVVALIYFVVMLEAVVGVVHLYLSKYKVQLAESFLYDIKSFFKYITSDIYHIALLVLGVLFVIGIIVYFVCQYEKDDGPILMVYLINISFGMLIMDEPILILCSKLSRSMGYNYLAFHPFYLWLIIMFISYLIYSIIATAWKNK